MHFMAYEKKAMREVRDDGAMCDAVLKRVQIAMPALLMVRLL
jgi:hypothetical protein